MEITQDINHQVAYLQGLAEGYQGKDARETRILAEIVNVLAGMADHLTNLQTYVRQLDDDLLSVEQETGLGEDGYVETDCPHCGEEVRFGESCLGEEGVQVTCPNCGGVVYAVAEDNDPPEEKTSRHPEN